MTLKTVAILQARMGSTRVPGKVMRNLNGRPVLRWAYDAICRAKGIDKVVLATSTLPGDDAIYKYCRKNKIPVFRGDEKDVLDRFYRCALKYDADIVLRLTADCPFLDPAVITEVVRLRRHENAAYASNVFPPSYPDGLDTECFIFDALRAAWKETKRETDRDCLTQFIIRNQDRFPAINLHCPLPELAKERWVLDTEADFLACRAIAKHVPYGASPSYTDILAILDKHPEIRALNASGVRNERFFDGLALEKFEPRSFKRSELLFERTSRVIPFGAQTFSKSHIQFPHGCAPLYVSHADGARIYDVDGNDYIDLVSAVLPVVLGYRDPDVDEAIRRQLDRGISFSLATDLEAELAEMLCQIIPCAEMVKFGKTGTDVTTAAIRLARAYTKKDHIIQTGYHGWADWSMARTDRNLGIPEMVRSLSHRATYGNAHEIEDLVKDLNHKVAAIIVEPNDSPDYLKFLRWYSTEHNIVLIFDEIITGFRYAMSGAQGLFGITPDLATFGKAMANGMPISALVGKRRLMKIMQPPDNIFYSGTFFGETLSIAAAIATIKKLNSHNVIKYLWDTGDHLTARIDELLRRHNLTKAISLSGPAVKKIINFHDVPDSKATKDQIRTYFMQEMIQSGVLIISSNNLSFAHKKPEIERIVAAYDATFSKIKTALLRGDIAGRVGNSVVAAAPLRATA